MKNNFCTIYLVRHGLTDWNIEGKIQGHTDIPLNTEGKNQAQELAKELRQIKFDKVYSSDLLRAKQTAEIISLEHKLEVETSMALRERNYGPYEGHQHDILEEIDRIMDKLEEKEKYSYRHHPGMESDGEIASRFLIYLKGIIVENPGKKILIVSHGGVIRHSLIKLGFYPYKGYLKIDNLAYAKIESDGMNFFLKETKGIKLVF